MKKARLPALILIDYRFVRLLQEIKHHRDLGGSVVELLPNFRVGARVCIEGGIERFSRWVRWERGIRM